VDEVTVRGRRAGAAPAGTSGDLVTYLRVPMPPHRAAVLVGDLAEQLAALHAEGRAHGVLPAGVRVETADGRIRPVLVASGPGTAAGDIAAAGSVLAHLLGASGREGDRPSRPPGAPPQLWSLVVECLHTDPAARPTAALLSRRLRDAARDLLLGVAASPGTALPPPSRIPAYVPGPSTSDSAPPAGRRRVALVLAVAVAAVVVLSVGAATLLDVTGGGPVPAAMSPPPPELPKQPAPTSAPPPSRPPERRAPADPVEVCAPPRCAARATVHPGDGRLTVCDNAEDGHSGVAVVTRPDGTARTTVWASDGNGKCADAELRLPDGATVVVRACTGDRPTNRIERCGEPETVRT
jgi:hypothetical protein